MSRDHKRVPASGSIILIIVLLTGIVLKEAYINNVSYYWLLVLLLPLLLFAIYNIKQKKTRHTKQLSDDRLSSVYAGSNPSRNASIFL